MKVILFTPYIDRLLGKDAKSRLALISELGKLVELHVVCLPLPTQPILLHGSVHEINFSLMSGKSKAVWMDLLKTVEPDIVHVSDCGMYQCAIALKWAKEAGYRTVLSPQGMLDEGALLRLLYQRRAMGRAEHVVVMKVAEKKLVRKYCTEDKVTQIVEGVEMGRMKMNGERRRKILLFNRNNAELNMEFLLEAVGRLKEELREYRIGVIDEGNPCFITLLKEKIKETGIERLFDFYETATVAQTGKRMMEAELFISLQETDERDMDVARALAYGTPVIIPRYSPWKEVENYNCGWWIDMSVEKIAAAIKKALELTERDKCNIGQNGRKLVEEKFCIKQTAAKLVEVYQKTISNEKDK